MTTPSKQPPDRRQQYDTARRAARRQALSLARGNGAPAITRPAYPGSQSSVRDAEPLAGMRAARDLETGARQAARDYIRAARETGRTWHDIGAALDLTPGRDPQQAGGTIAEAAWTYAAGNPGTGTACRYGRSFTWTCLSCDQNISDRGLRDGPADDEHGHAPGCRRLAATIAAWDAGWDAAGWEAGQ